MSVWEKVASVTTGGKPYFWYKQTPEYYIWVVWSRQEKLWKGHIEERKSGESVFQYFSTPEHAKKEIDRMLKTHKLVFFKGGADWDPRRKGIASIR